jgi:hypothetical protein
MISPILLLRRWGGAFFGAQHFYAPNVTNYLPTVLGLTQELSQTLLTLCSL